MKVIKENVIKNEKIKKLLLIRIKIFEEIYEISKFNIGFLNIYLKKNPTKLFYEKKKNELYLYLKEEDIIEIKDFLEKNKNVKEKAIEEYAEDELRELKYLVEFEWYDKRDLEIEKNKIIKNKEKDIIEIAWYIWEKLKYKFLTNKNNKNNKDIEELIKIYNRYLAKIKFLFLNL